MKSEEQGNKKRKSDREESKKMEKITYGGSKEIVEHKNKRKYTAWGRK